MLSRRTLLCASATAAVVAGSGLAAATAPRSSGSFASWDDVRALFPLSPNKVHMSAMLITSHPRPVSDAIERHRASLDADPVEYLEAHGTRLTEASRAAAADRLETDPRQVALTESTTSGVGVVYTGLALRKGQEVLSTDEDYYVTHEAVRVAAERTGAMTRRVSRSPGRTLRRARPRVSGSGDMNLLRLRLERDRPQRPAPPHVTQQTHALPRLGPDRASGPRGDALLHDFMRLTGRA
jgi:hypothetical protein